MHYWKFNLEVKSEQPVSIPTLDHIKKWYYSGSFGFNEFDVARTGIYKCGGWAFDFREDMKKYVVKFNDGDLAEYWAPNKTSLRGGLRLRYIKYILEIPRQYC